MSSMSNALGPIKKKFLNLPKPAQQQILRAHSLQGINLSQVNHPLIQYSHPERASSLIQAPNEFIVYPNYFSAEEQTVMLKEALEKLDSDEGGKFRKEKKARLKTLKEEAALFGTKERGGSADRLLTDKNPTLQHMFLPAELYNFERSHFDKVITGYREKRISYWSKATPLKYQKSVQSILSQLDILFPDPTPPIICHALHLGPEGVIGPHIDHVEAFGGTLVGISLGASRIMRVERGDEENGGEKEYVDVLLESGSVYVQRGDIRYKFKHSIPMLDSFKGKPVEKGHRLSIMLRDEKPPLLDPNLKPRFFELPTYEELRAIEDESIDLRNDAPYEPPGLDNYVFEHAEIKKRVTPDQQLLLTAKKEVEGQRGVAEEGSELADEAVEEPVEIKNSTKSS